MATRCQLFTELLAGFPGELQPQPVLLEGRLCVNTYPHFTQHRIKQKGQKHPQLMDCLVLRIQTWPEDLITTWYGTNILLEAAPFMEVALSVSREEHQSFTSYKRFLYTAVVSHAYKQTWKRSLTQQPRKAATCSSKADRRFRRSLKHKDLIDNDSSTLAWVAWHLKWRHSPAACNYGGRTGQSSLRRATTSWTAQTPQGQHVISANERK